MLSNVLPLTSNGRFGSADVVIGGAAIPPMAGVVGLAVGVAACVEDGFVVNVTRVVAVDGVVELKPPGRVVFCAETAVSSPIRNISRLRRSMMKGILCCELLGENKLVLFLDKVDCSRSRST